MSYNREMRVNSLNEINLQLMKQAIYLCYRDGITTKAPLGFSGDDIVLFGEPQYPNPKGGTKRHSLISIRNYCGSAELLITDTEGRFLFYGRYDVNIGLDFVARQYLSIFKKVRRWIEVSLPQNSKFNDIPDADVCTISKGFKMISLWQMAQSSADERSVATEAQ